MIDRFSLRAKLMASFGVLVVLIVGLGLFLAEGIKSTDDAYSEMVSDSVVPTQAGSIIRVHLWAMNANMYDHVLSDNRQGKDALKADNVRRSTELQGELGTIKSAVSPGEEQLLQDFETNLTATYGSWEKVYQASEQNRTAEAVALLKEADVTFDAANHIGAVIRRSSESMNGSAQSLSAVASQMSANAEETAAQSQMVASTARAGDAGKGFSVVANEVKELAKETAKATDEIGSRIEAIQRDVATQINSEADALQAILEGQTR